jgi:hypothetical protein
MKARFLAARIATSSTRGDRPLESGGVLTITYACRWVAAVNRPRREIAERNRASTQYRAVTNRHPGSNECIRRNPNVITNIDWRAKKRHRCEAMVM